MAEHDEVHFADRDDEIDFKRPKRKIQIMDDEKGDLPDQDKEVKKRNTEEETPTKNDVNAAYAYNPKKFSKYCLHFIVAQYEEEEPDEAAVEALISESIQKNYLSARDLYRLCIKLTANYCTDAIDIIAELTVGMVPPANMTPKKLFLMNEMGLFSQE